MSDVLKSKDMNPFVKNTPSVFVICSPFQALCAIAAIRQLEICNYKIIVFLPRGEARNSQLEYLLHNFNVKYESFSFIIRRIVNVLPRCSALLRRNEGYKRLFVGDFRNMIELAIGCNYVSDGADVVCLDDGNATIDLLKDQIADPLAGINKKWLSIIEKRRKIFFLRNLLTIYGDIPNPKYNVTQLLLDKVVNIKNEGNHRKKAVYIVGTNVESFCKPLKIPEDFYIRKLGELMKNLRRQYPDEEVVFIPHGREKKDYGQHLCKEYGCTFHRPKMMIELDLLSRENPPRAIYGFTSAALYTLKKLFPHSKVVNIMFESNKDNPFFKGYVICSNYFLQNGIEWVKEPLS